MRNDSADEKDDGKYGGNKNSKKLGGATSSSFGQSKTKGITEETATDEQPKRPKQKFEFKNKNIKIAKISTKKVIF